MQFSVVSALLVSLVSVKCFDEGHVVNISGNVGSYVESDPCHSTTEPIRVCETTPEIIESVPISSCEHHVIEPPCDHGHVVEKSPVEVLVVNVIPQVNQTQSASTEQPTPTTSSPPDTPTDASPSASPSAQPTIIVQQNANTQGPTGGFPGPMRGPFGGRFGGRFAGPVGPFRGPCGSGGCGLFNPIASALRANVAARFAARMGF